MKGWGFAQKEAHGFGSKFGSIKTVMNLFNNYEKSMQNQRSEFLKEHLVLMDHTKVDNTNDHSELHQLLKIQISRKGDFLEANTYSEKSRYVKSNGKIYFRDKMLKQFHKFEIEQGLQDDMNALIKTKAGDDLADFKKRKMEENF